MKDRRGRADELGGGKSWWWEEKEDHLMSQLAPPVEIYWVSRSPFAWRVLLTAEVKGIPYEGKLLEASKGELKTPEFLAINPLGPVPAIRDGNLTLHESLAMMVYLDCKHPNPPLFGRTAEEAGRIFQCISEFISDFGDTLSGHRCLDATGRAAPRL
jgi:glutathione S-transferase